MALAQRQGRLNGWATLDRCELPGLAVDATTRQRRELGGAQVTQTAADDGQPANRIQPLRTRDGT